jgi:hypothetical protein
VYGLSSAATGPNGVSHWGDTKVIVSLAAAAVLLVAFAVIEVRSKSALTRISAQDVRRNLAASSLWQPIGSQRPDLLERCGLMTMVSVGGSAIRVPDGAKLICYLP